MKLIFYILAFAAGIALSMEGAIAGTLGETIGELESSYFIFLTGTILLGLTTLFFGKGKLSETVRVPKWNLLGGVLGIIYLTLLVISVPFVGVGVSMVSVIIGQMVMSVVIEHYGWLGSATIKVGKERVAAIALMAVALFFIF
ncbi:membrane protein [Pontibacillus halophilus JSM 076056 = DSM 19796]|uniref:Membrane protein n=1 Tax=Pontibacillus halophilus JSM 076056 = DSM 19796 TaxID=1385510 RepID=A0A0A5GGM4_9BACI|nr:DMT family transporter [Pontibacillus halophilus]KGX91139.1 membrane protein [Pontibacillus halophilus JSM 076056 = DSM 19796]